MESAFIQLMILFFVIFDPFASFTVFLTATAGENKKEKHKITILALSAAAGLSLLVIIFSQNLFFFFNTTFDEFKVAGGIVLSILGIKMAMGLPLRQLENFKNNSNKAIASIIGTPLLTGPAAITAIILSISEHGRVLTLLAVMSVLIITLIIFLFAETIERFLTPTGIQVISTILGLITISWGVGFIVQGVIAIAAAI